jgi:trk system potassium uptake protein TrkA
MKKFVTIGLGNFGINLAKTLCENECEVLGIDIDPQVVNQAKDFITYAMSGDATDRESLEKLSLNDYDGVIISIGQNMAPSILITLHLKELGISNTIVRAISEDHGKILSMIGATSVVFPEKDIAMRIAVRLAMKNALDYLPLGDDYGILEVVPPSSFLNKNLKDLEIRPRFNCHVIGIKYYSEKVSSELQLTKESSIVIAPPADQVIDEKSIMIIVGKYTDIERLKNIK